MSVLFTPRHSTELALLDRAFTEYCSLYDGNNRVDVQQYKNWLIVNYGVKYIIANYPLDVDHQFIQVVDEQKYLLFLMRFNCND